MVYLSVCTVFPFGNLSGKTNTISTMIVLHLVSLTAVLSLFISIEEPLVTKLRLRMQGRPVVNKYKTVK